MDDPALVEHDRIPREPPDDGEILLDEENRLRLAHPFENGRHLTDDQRREPLRRLVDEQDPVLVQERPADGHHLLLAARQRPGPLARPLVEDREQVVDEVVAWRPVAFGEPKVLLDGQTGEDLTVLGDVADAELDDPVRRQARQLGAVEDDRATHMGQSHDSPEGGRLPDSVSAEQCGDAAGAHRKRHALEDVGLAVVGVDVLDGQERRSAPADSSV